MHRRSQVLPFLPAPLVCRKPSNVSQQVRPCWETLPLARSSCCCLWCIFLPSSPGHLCWANLPSWNQEKAHMALPGSIACAGGFWPLVPGCCQLKGSQRIFRLGPSFSTHQVMLLCKRPGKAPLPFHGAGFWVGLTSKNLSRFAVKSDLWFNPV